MKVCLVSYDFWGYDAHIVEELRRQGVQAMQLNLGHFGHKNLAARAHNAFSKVFLGKNLKNQRRSELIFKKLKEAGIQDQVLTINPELFDRQTHEFIRQYAKKYTAYLYDSVARNPVSHLLDLFDEVYSFDREDCRNYGFKEITNYNYLDGRICGNKPEFDLIYLASIDDRLQHLPEITPELFDLNLKPLYLISGKKAWKKNFGKLWSPKKWHSAVRYSKKKIGHDEIPGVYCRSRTVLDLVREGQNGLSFRFFEAMALRKKVVTNNANVLNYDFYNPNNILVLTGDKKINREFFETSYEELPAEIYEKYTLKNWVKIVFNL